MSALDKGNGAEQGDGEVMGFVSHEVIESAKATEQSRADVILFEIPLFIIQRTAVFCNQEGEADCGARSD